MRELTNSFLLPSLFLKVAESKTQRQCAFSLVREYFFFFFFHVYLCARFSLLRSRLSCNYG